MATRARRERLRFPRAMLVRTKFANRPTDQARFVAQAGEGGPIPDAIETPLPPRWTYRNPSLNRVLGAAPDPRDLLLHQPLGNFRDHVRDNLLDDPGSDALEHAARDLLDQFLADEGRSTGRDEATGGVDRSPSSNASSAGERIGNRAWTPGMLSALRGGDGRRRQRRRR